MNAKNRLRREKARRAIFDLKELVADVLAEYPHGLYPREIADKLGTKLLKETPGYKYERTDLTAGILKELLYEGRIERRQPHKSEHGKWFPKENDRPT